MKKFNGPALGINLFATAGVVALAVASPAAAQDTDEAEAGVTETATKPGGVT
jgi:hypothetical protein